MLPLIFVYVKMCEFSRKNINIYIGYPTIKMFFPDGRVEDYNGGRTASDIVQQALTMFEEVAEPPELYQLLGQDTIDSACADVQVNYNDS